MADPEAVQAVSQPAKKPTWLMISSIVSSLLAVFILPPLFGGLAIFLGYQAYKREPHIGRVCMIIGGIALILGAALGVFLALVQMMG